MHQAYIHIQKYITEVCATAWQVQHNATAVGSVERGRAAMSRLLWRR